MGKITDQMIPNTRTDKLQGDIRKTEIEISETLHQIEKKLSPARIKENVRKKAIDYSVRTAIITSDKIRNNPVQAAIIGVGTISLIAWRMMRRRRKNRISAEPKIEVVANPKAHESSFLKNSLKSCVAGFRRHPVATTRRMVTMGRTIAAIGSILGATLRNRRSRTAQVTGRVC